jgi:AAA domain/Bifunctional DNA primase/polymerase, N-terminal
MTALDFALEYIARGWAPIPVPSRSKNPGRSGWEQLRTTHETVANYFNGATNIGILLGAPSGGLTDIDLDCDEAVSVAAYFLPKTDAIFGRAGRRNSHWLYTTTLADAGAPGRILYNDPSASKDRKSTLVELRVGLNAAGDGAQQTIFPGSTHETGEPVEWEPGKTGDPAIVDGAALHVAVKKVAAAAVFARHWPNGRRHDAALALAGMFAHSNWAETQAKLFLEAVTKAAGDTEWCDRIRAVEDSYAALRAGRHVAGFPSLTEHIDERVARRAAEWLDILALDGTRKAQTAEAELPADDATVPIHWHGEPDTSPLREWVVDGMLPRRGTALLSGQWGTYKTFVALDLAVAIMTGGTFAGRKVDRQAGVLFIAVEGQDEIRARLAAVIEDKVRDTIVPEGCQSVDPDAMPFAWVEVCPKLSGVDALPKFRNLVTAVAAGMQERFGLPLGLVEINTLSPAAGFEQANESSENQRVMTVLSTAGRENDACVLAIDHFGKDVSTGTRNSSVKEAHVDAVLALLGERDLAGNVSDTRMAIRKLRGGPTGAEIKFSNREVSVEAQGHLHTSLVIDWTEGEAKTARPKQPPKVPQSLKTFKRAVDAMLRDVGRSIRPWPDGPEVRAVDRERVREEFYKAAPADSRESKRKAFGRAERHAVGSRVIVSRELGTATWFWLPSREEEEAVR